jgi:hypothetical protein
MAMNETKNIQQTKIEYYDLNFEDVKEKWP